MTGLRCAAHRLRLASRLDRPDPHASTCLRCQAAEARYRSMLRGLRELGEDELAAPGVIADGVAAEIASGGFHSRAPGRHTVVAIAGGTAVAIAAAAAIAGIRHRRVA